MYCKKKAAGISRKEFKVRYMTRNFSLDYGLKCPGFTFCLQLQCGYMELGKHIPTKDEMRLNNLLLLMVWYKNALSDSATSTSKFLQND